MNANCEVGVAIVRGGLLPFTPYVLLDTVYYRRPN